MSIFSRHITKQRLTMSESQNSNERRASLVSLTPGAGHLGESMENNATNKAEPRTREGFEKL